MIKIISVENTLESLFEAFRSDDGVFFLSFDNEGELVGEYNAKKLTMENILTGFIEKKRVAIIRVIREENTSYNEEK